MTPVTALARPVLLLLCVALAGCNGEAPAVASPASTPPEDVTKTLAASCDANDYQACFDLGERYRTANGVGEDLTRANELFDRACVGGFARSCTSLGSSYLRGRGVAKDTKRAMTLFLKSCETGWAWGCHTLAGRYWTGDGGTKDHKEAEVYYQKACDAGLRESCNAVQEVQADPQYEN